MVIKMNWNQAKGNWKQFMGKAKAKWGDLTDDELTQIAGERDALDDRVFADLPLNWRSEIEPDLIGSLEQSKEQVVTIKFQPPADVAVGDYDAPPPG